MRTKLVLTFLSGMLPGIAMATNGYFLPGFGVKSEGAGGIGVAVAQDALSVVTNPANATETGMRGDLGITLFNPERWSATGNATGVPPDPTGNTGGFGFNGASESANPLYVLPDMGFTMPLNSRLSLGFAVVGNGGMNTTYTTNFFGLGKNPAKPLGASVPATVGVDLMQLLAPVTLAYKVNSEQSLGASLNLAAQRFKANGLGQFATFGISSNPTLLTNNGYDFSFGVGGKLGWLGKFLDDRVSVGATWSSRVDMSHFKEYAGLFADGGDFDIPENFAFGVALKPINRLTAAFDVERILYKQVASVGDPGPGTTGGSGYSQDFILDQIANGTGTSSNPYALGEPQGMGFGWTDMTVYKVGLIYDMSDKLTVRAGYNYGHMPIRHDQAVFSALAPAVVQRHYSLGFTYSLPTELPMELSGFYMYVPNVEVMENAQAVVDQVAYQMHQNILGIGLGVKY